MKNITRLLALVLVAVMVCGFAGCGATDSAKYVIYSHNAFAPFEYLDQETNTYVGVDMDIMAAIAADQGFEYEMKNEGFDAAMGAVQAGQADGMIAGMTINDERKKNYDFSEGYFEDGSILVTAKDSAIAAEADLAGKKIAAKKGTTSTH